MEQQLGKILWLFITVATTFVIVALYGPALGTAMDTALRQDAAYTAQDLSGVISLIGSGTDGMQHIFTLPRTDKPDCIEIHSAYIESKLAGASSSSFVTGSAALLLTRLDNSDAVKGDTAAAMPWGPIKITCSRKDTKQLIITRSGSSVTFSMKYS